MDINEVETDDPRTGTEDHCCLVAEKAIDSSFEFSSRDGVKFGKPVVPGVEDCSFDSENRVLRAEIKR